MSETSAAKIDSLISSTEARALIRQQMRLFMGRGRRYSVAAISQGTGIPLWQLNQAMIDPQDVKHRPLPPESFLSLVLFLGADFLQPIAARCGLGVFDQPALDACPRAMAADNTEDNATLVRAAMDGIFDGEERPSLRECGNRMIARGQQLIAMSHHREDERTA